MFFLLLFIIPTLQTYFSSDKNKKSLRKSWGFLKVVHCCYWKKVSTVSRWKTICKHTTELAPTLKDRNGLVDFHSVENKSSLYTKHQSNARSILPSFLFFTFFCVFSGFSFFRFPFFQHDIFAACIYIIVSIPVFFQEPFAQWHVKKAQGIG